MECLLLLFCFYVLFLVWIAFPFNPVVLQPSFSWLVQLLTNIIPSSHQPANDFVSPEANTCLAWEGIHALEIFLSEIIFPVSLFSFIAAKSLVKFWSYKVYLFLLHSSFWISWWMDLDLSVSASGVNTKISFQLELRTISQSLICFGSYWIVPTLLAVAKFSIT